MAATVLGIHLTGNHASRPTSGVSAGTLYSCTTHSLIYQTTDTGSTWVTWATLGTSSTTVATDTIWDAAGDLAVGSGADTATKLAKGSAGGALSMINAAVAWNSGTSNPGSAVAGDRYWRTDLGLEIYYTGSIWLTTTLYREPLTSQDVLIPLAANGGAGYLATWGTTFQLFLDNFWAFTNVLTTNDGTKFWTVVLQDDAGSTITGSSFTTAADTASTKTFHKASIGASYTSTNKQMQIVGTKTSTPGNLYIAGSVSYRLIVT